MKYFRNRVWLPVAVTLSLAGSVCVANSAMAEDHAEEHHVQESHVHGLANLFMVLEGQDLLIELESPAMNLIGFEHAPHNEEQRQQVEQTEQLLAAGDKLFSFSGGQCQLQQADIEIAVLEDGHEDEHHQEDGHDDHHDSHHEGEHEEHSASEAEHSDIEAKYLFKCQQPGALRAINVTMFNVFSGVEELSAQWVVRSFQGGKTLSPESSRIELQ